MDRARTTDRSAIISRAWPGHWYHHPVHSSSPSFFPFEQAFRSILPCNHPIGMVGAWISSYCLNTEGFPKILYATLQKLGVKDRPEYEGREYEKYGTERCEVTIYIVKSEEFPDITEAWNVTTTGFRFIDTYQVVAHKALQHLCQIYEEPIARTPMRFFPPLEKNQRAWRLAWRLCKGGMRKKIVLPWCT